MKGVKKNVTVIFIGVFFVIAMPAAKYLYGIMNYYPKTIKETTRIDSIQNAESNKRNMLCDTIKLLGKEVVEHDYDGGAMLYGIFCNDIMNLIHIEIGVSRGLYKQDYFIDNGKLMKVIESQDVFLYNDSLATFDYTQLNREYEVTYEIQPRGIEKLAEKGIQTLGVAMTTEQKSDEYRAKFEEYKMKINKKRERGKKK